MQQISLQDAIQHLSHYVDMVEKGEEIIITRRGKPIVRLLSIPNKHRLSSRQQKVWKQLHADMLGGYKLERKKLNREKLHER